MDGVADHVCRSLFAFWASGHSCSLAFGGKLRKGGMMMDFDEARRQLERTAEYNRREQQKIYATAKQKLNELANYTPIHR